MDVALRNRTYALFVQLGRAPRPEELGDRDEVLAGWSALHDGHALVLTADRKRLRMANPFSAVPTAYRVRAHGRWWYANCGWDCYGIAAALGERPQFEASCADCGGPITQDDAPFFQVQVPAAHWWDDIGFT